MMIGHYV